MVIVSSRKTTVYDLNEWTRQRWEKGNRYYVAEVRQDLFGDWQIALTWGSKDSARGNAKRRIVADHADALAQLATVTKRRTSRGYQEQMTYAEPL